MKLLLWLSTLFLCSNQAPAIPHELEAQKVREARQIQTRAMATGDVELAASFWTDDVTLRRGLGASIVGKEAYRALLNPAPNEKSIIFVRHPDLIEISPDWPLAYESGTWTARYGNAEGPIALSGRYSAQWVKRQEAWLIRSELYVALVCHERANDWPSLP